MQFKMMEPQRLIRFLGRLRLIYVLRFRGIRLGSGIHFDVSGKFYYGKGCSVGRNATIVVPSSGRLTIGNYCYLGRNIEVGSGGTIDIGDRTSLQDRCILLGNVKIGANCIFSYNIVFKNYRLLEFDKVKSYLLLYYFLLKNFITDSHIGKQYLY
jgi:NDP-sugar pyrophosphorylase family protein